MGFFLLMVCLGTTAHGGGGGRLVWRVEYTVRALDGVLECSRTWDRFSRMDVWNGADIMIIPVDYYHQSLRRGSDCAGRGGCFMFGFPRCAPQNLDEWAEGGGYSTMKKALFNTPRWRVTMSTCYETVSPPFVLLPPGPFAGSDSGIRAHAEAVGGGGGRGVGMDGHTTTSRHVRGSNK